MSEYFALIPYFLAFVTFGVAVNYLFFMKQLKLTTRMIAREIFGAIWVSAIIYAVTEQFFDFSILFTLILCSVGGFANSKVINFLRKDLIEFTFGKFKEWISNKLSPPKKEHKHRYKDEDNEDKPL